MLPFLYYRAIETDIFCYNKCFRMHCPASAEFETASLYLLAKELTTGSLPSPVDQIHHAGRCSWSKALEESH